MQWMVPRARLGEDQRAVLDTSLRALSGQRPVWVEGAAGTGKSVLLVHAMIEARRRQPRASLCFVTFTNALKDLIRSGLPAEAQDIPVQTVAEFEQAKRSYDVVFVDEVQDLKRGEIERLRARSGRLILGGDAAQSIYADRLSREELQAMLAPERRTLDVLYRLPQNLRDIANAILPEAAIQSKRLDRMANAEVLLANADSLREELDWVWREAIRRSKPGSPSAVLVSGHDQVGTFIRHVASAHGASVPRARRQRGKYQYGEVNAALHEADVPLRYLGSGFGALAETDAAPLVVVMTYHSAKGLDFESVFLPFLAKTLTIWRGDESMSRRLLFVAVTRSRRHLVLSYTGDAPHPLIADIPDRLLVPIRCDASDDGEDDDDDIF